jgi:predicted nucleotidyltransferase
VINIDAKLNELKNYFKSNTNILAAWFIGSYGTVDQTDDSDIDIALLFDKPIDILDEMDISCKISELVEFDNIDTINLLCAPITLQFKVIDEGRSIYEKYYLDRFMHDFYESYGVRSNA